MRKFIFHYAANGEREYADGEIAIRAVSAPGTYGMPTISVNGSLRHHGACEDIWTLLNCHQAIHDTTQNTCSYRKSAKYLLSRRDYQAVKSGLWQHRLNEPRYR